MAGNQKCFMVEKQEGVSDSRRLEFADNDQMKEFKSVVCGLTTLKQYLEKTISFNQKIDPSITHQLTIEQGGHQNLRFKDTYLND